MAGRLFQPTLAGQLPHPPSQSFTAKVLLLCGFRQAPWPLCFSVLTLGDEGRPLPFRPQAAVGPCELVNTSEAVQRKLALGTHAPPLL